MINYKQISGATDEENASIILMVEELNKLWEEKKICDKKGIQEMKPEKITEESYRIIKVNFMDKGFTTYNLSLREYKHYKIIARTVLGI